MRNHLRISICASLVGLLLLCSGAFAAEPPFTAALFSPDGKQVLLGSQRGVEIRSWPESKAIGSLKTELLNIHDLAFSPDGQTLLVAGGSPGEAGIVEAWEWQSQQRLKRLVVHQDVVYRVAWSPAGDEWATASGDGTCKIVTQATGETRLTYPGHSRPVMAIGFVAAGKFLATAGVDQTLQLWNAASGELIQKRDNHLGAINDLAVRPAKDAMAAPMLATAGEDRTVRFWQPITGRLVRFVSKLPAPPRVIAWSADGSKLLAGCSDGSVLVIDPDHASILKTEQILKGRIHAIGLSPDGKAGVVAGEGGEVASITRLLTPNAR